MSNSPTVPQLTGASSINVRKPSRIHVDCPNPTCTQILDVTDVNFGTNVGCPECGNYLFAPEYKPPWYAKTWRFVLALATSFIAGMLAQYVGRLVFSS